MTTFYTVDSTAVSVPGLWRASNNNPLTFVIAGLLKVFRVRMPMTSEDPPVDSTLPWIAPALPADIVRHFEKFAPDLAALGFTDPVHHFVYDAGMQSRTYWSTYYHPQGEICARIHNRYWDTQPRKERTFFVQFFTFFSDGSWLVSSTDRRGTVVPAKVELNEMPGASVSDLFAAHRQLVEARAAEKAVVQIRSRGELICACENLHVLKRDFHLRRGFFRQRSAHEMEQARQFATHLDQVRAEGAQHPEILAEIMRLEEAKASWRNAIWILAISVLAFVATAGAGQRDWSTGLWLIPILFFHESGHWLAMRIFGYRNLRMFFIPMFGAAVSGQHRNVAGWKKAIVSLAGPLPGIALGAVGTVVAIVTKKEWLQQVSMWLVFLNGFNLVPVLPLDGGRFLQSTLFCRNRWLDVGFRVAAIGGLILLTVAGISRTLAYVGIILAISLPLAFKTAKLIDHFRREPLPPAPPDIDRISRPTAEVLISAVKADIPKATNRVVAQTVLNIYETLNARPPGFLATAGLLAVYAGGMVVAMGAFLALSISQFAGWGPLPHHRVNEASVQAWIPLSASKKNAERDWIVASLQNRDAAKGEFQRDAAKVPSGVVSMQFGDSVLFGWPKADATKARHWFEENSARWPGAMFMTNGEVAMTLDFFAPDEKTASELEGMLGGSLETGVSNMIPPWNPASSSSAFQPHLAARRVFWKIHQRLGQADDSQSGESTMKLLAAIKHGDSNAMAGIINDNEKRQRQRQESALAELTAQYAGTPYTSLVEYEKQLMQSETNGAGGVDAKLLAKIGAQLGTFKPGEGGWAMEPLPFRYKNLHFRLFVLDLSQPESNLPQLIQWLTAHRCSYIRYEFQDSSIGDD